MKKFLIKQLKKEKDAFMGIGKCWVNIHLMFWLLFLGLTGVVLLFTSEWFVGLIVIIVDAYILNRMKHDRKKVSKSEIKQRNKNNNIIYCAKCGTKHDQDARFCSKCGSDL
jgi:ribosomal protein L40E